MATMISMSELSRGTVLELDGSLFVILSYQGFKTGKGNSEARMRMKLRDVRTGYTQDRTFRTDERVARAMVENRASQFLYSDGEAFHFMDTVTFEQIYITSDMLGDRVNYLLPDGVISVEFFEGEPVGIELPQTVDLTVAETTPTIKGATASAQVKPATLETGLVVQVPPFVVAGDKIRVNTETGEYQARV